MQELARLQWVYQHFNLLITGPTGCGKTYIACALAHKACLTGLTARYYRLPRLWHELKVAKANGTYPVWLSQLAKIDVLILDDWGLITPDIEQRRDLLEMLDDRYQRRSTIITSQLPVTLWHEHLNDATLADAILDRLIHNSKRIEFNNGCDSLRKKKKTALQAEAIQCTHLFNSIDMSLISFIIIGFNNKSVLWRICNVFGVIAVGRRCKRIYNRKIWRYEISENRCFAF